MLTQAEMLQRAKEISGQIKYIKPLHKTANVLISKVTDLGNAEAGQVRAFITPWDEGIKYKQGRLVSYLGEIYRIGSDHTSSSTYKPGDEGTTALYSHILLDDLGFEIWQEFDGVSGSYALGQIVFDSDADEHYTSDLANNVWGPPSTQPTYWHVSMAEGLEQYLI